MQRDGEEKSFYLFRCYCHARRDNRDCLRAARLDWEWWYLTKNESIECHHCESNDENEPVVVDASRDGDHQRADDSNKVDVTAFPAVEAVVRAIVVDSAGVVVVGEGDEDDEGVRDDEARQMDLIAMMMMSEAREREKERDPREQVGEDRTHRFDLMGEIVRGRSRGTIWTVLIVRR